MLKYFNSIKKKKKKKQNKTKIQNESLGFKL